MSAARIITDMGAAVAFVDGKVKLSGLDRLPAKVVERVLNVARERREELRRELDPTGLGWLPGPPDGAAPSFDGWWAAFDLADVCRLYGVRIVHAGKRILAVFDPTMEPELVAYASELLAEARPYLAANMDRLPILTQAEAVKILLDIMRQHKGLRFCRGDGGSRWPLFPKGWTAGQKATVQSLWFAAGDALDEDSFMEVDA
ncbi:hypothetical protein [Solidesulfovibrio alcoholivorans]|uniref:hypothetical protein n=1 Tax=Solidesulfovibrio alcoholivorans TaxID=81406 RepID=UPI000496F778|nr:hypothetical protein [Solidesulfovibrio alcoholivorans]